MLKFSKFNKKNAGLFTVAFLIIGISCGISSAFAVTPEPKDGPRSEEPGAVVRRMPSDSAQSATENPANPGQVADLEAGIELANSNQDDEDQMHFLLNKMITAMKRSDTFASRLDGTDEDLFSPIWPEVADKVQRQKAVALLRKLERHFNGTSQAHLVLPAEEIPTFTQAGPLFWALVDHFEVRTVQTQSVPENSQIEVRTAQTQAVSEYSQSSRRVRRSERTPPSFASLCSAACCSGLAMVVGAPVYFVASGAGGNCEGKFGDKIVIAGSTVARVGAFNLCENKFGPSFVKPDCNPDGCSCPVGYTVSSHNLSSAFIWEEGGTLPPSGGVIGCLAGDNTQSSAIGEHYNQRAVNAGKVFMGFAAVPAAIIVAQGAWYAAGEALNCLDYCRDNLERARTNSVGASVRQEMNQTNSVGASVESERTRKSWRDNPRLMGLITESGIPFVYYIMDFIEHKQVQVNSR